MHGDIQHPGDSTSVAGGYHIGYRNSVSQRVEADHGLDELHPSKLHLYVGRGWDHHIPELGHSVGNSTQAHIGRPEQLQRFLYCDIDGEGRPQLYFRTGQQDGDGEGCYGADHRHACIHCFGSGCQRGL